MTRTMGVLRDELEDFIDSIPDSKLTGFTTSSGAIYKDRNFCLDMQGVHIDFYGSTTLSVSDLRVKFSLRLTQPETNHIISRF